MYLVIISLACLGPAAGSGVNVYMIDTGIKFTHQEFGHMDGTPGSRAVPGFSVFGDNNSSDCYGHGTHTAATVGGKRLKSAHSRSCYIVTMHDVKAATQSLCAWWRLLYSHTVNTEAVTLRKLLCLSYSHFACSGSCYIAFSMVEVAIQTLCTI